MGQITGDASEKPLTAGDLALLAGRSRAYVSANLHRLPRPTLAPGAGRPAQTWHPAALLAWADRITADFSDDQCRLRVALDLANPTTRRGQFAMAYQKDPERQKGTRSGDQTRYTTPIPEGAPCFPQSRPTPGKAPAPNGPNLPSQRPAPRWQGSDHD